MSSLGLTVRVTGYSSQGGRKYMEDAFSIAAQETDDRRDLDYAFFAIYDGHGGPEASEYARAHLMNNIVSLTNFWSDDDELVLKAIRDGFLNTHREMWKVVNQWPKTVTGLQSTAGTTASVAFLRNSKLYIGHVGDSRIVLGYEDPSSEYWKARSLTTDHKPNTPNERKRIYECGGSVIKKAGVDRVVWKRPRIDHRGPIRRSTDFDKVPFLAIARSLGDLWSYNGTLDEFVVSPMPDAFVVPLNPDKDRCLIIASDGLWNVVSSESAVRMVHYTEQENEHIATKLGITDPKNQLLNIPSKVLVNSALERWNSLKSTADNTSVITIILDHLDSPKSLLQQNDDFVKTMFDLDSAEKNKDSLNENNSENADVYYDDRERAFLQGRSPGNFRAPFVGANNYECDNQILANNSLHLLNTPEDQCNLQKYQLNDNNENLSPFPRWSKSATGQTSLWKLASWSHLVNKRRFSEPTPSIVPDFNESSRSISTDVPTENKFQSHSKTLADAASSISRRNTNSGENSIAVASTSKVPDASSTRNSYPFLCETIKRKFAETLGCCNNNAFDYSNHPNCENISSWKRKPAADRPFLTAFKDIREFGMSQNCG